MTAEQMYEKYRSYMWLHCRVKVPPWGVLLNAERRVWDSMVKS